MSHAADRAGQLPGEADLIDVTATHRAYHELVPDPADPVQRVAFGTSGHRGAAVRSSFNELHVAAITRAVADHRAAAGIDGPMFVGRDTHALSEPAFATVLRVLTAAGVDVRVDDADGFTPTPAVSHAILTHNRGDGARADGIVITPSHNPPEDGGIKYNPPTGGPATTETAPIEAAANALLEAAVREGRAIPMVPLEDARAAATGHPFVERYVADLPSVLDVQRIARSGVRVLADPLGGAAVAYWPAIADAHGLDITAVETVDPTFRFVPLDWDGRIRMDCSSRFAMRPLTTRAAEYDLCVGNDADADRHGVVVGELGLVDPNSWLAASLAYLLDNRPGWSPSLGVGTTVVTSGMLDRIARDRGRSSYEVPVGFKWYVDGLLGGQLAFGGEESAGASFVRHDGTPWTTDKDGILLALLAAELHAATDGAVAAHVAQVRARYGEPRYRRIDSVATRAQKARLKQLAPADVRLDDLAGDPVTGVHTDATGNGAAIGGVKVTTANGWFCARPSGTEDVYKIYAESFVDDGHLERLLEDARTVVDAALADA